MTSSGASWSHFTWGWPGLSFWPGKNSITLPPAWAVFSIASNTVNRLKVYAWQPIAKAPLRYSSGIAPAKTVSDTTKGVRTMESGMAMDFISFGRGDLDRANCIANAARCQSQKGGDT